MATLPSALAALCCHRFLPSPLLSPPPPPRTGVGVQAPAWCFGQGCPRYAWNRPSLRLCTGGAVSKHSPACSPRGVSDLATDSGGLCRGLQSKSGITGNVRCTQELPVQGLLLGSSELTFGERQGHCKYSTVLDLGLVKSTEGKRELFPVAPVTPGGLSAWKEDCCWHVLRHWAFASAPGWGKARLEVKEQECHAA